VAFDVSAINCRVKAQDATTASFSRYFVFNNMELTPYKSNKLSP
jgi:hypothetical protein